MARQRGKNDYEGFVRTLNLGLGGLPLVTDYVFKPGEPFRLEILSGDSVLRVEGEVVYREGSGKKFKVGGGSQRYHRRLSRAWKEKRFGLMGLQERAHILEGISDIDSKSGLGNDDQGSLAAMIIKRTQFAAVGNEERGEKNGTGTSPDRR